MLLAIVNAASYGPDIRLKSDGISGDLIKQFEPNTAHRWLLWFDILMLYYIYLFIISFTEMNSAVATTKWYFTRKKESAFMPGLAAILLSGQYHCGTVAKLSLYKLAFKFFRNCAAMLKSALKKGKQDSNFVRFLLAAFLPVMAAYERYLKYITKETFIITSMWGEEYFRASRMSFFMTKFRHPDHGYSVLSWISYLLFSLKVSISLLIASCVYVYCYFLTISPLRNDISTVDTPIMPFLFVFITSLFLTSVWIAPYDMMLRTILECYSMDGEMFVGDQRFTEEFIQIMVDELVEVTERLRNDKTFFCFACKKKKDLKNGGSGGQAEWTEDMDDLKEAEMHAEEDEDKFSDEELKEEHHEEDKGIMVGDDKLEEKHKAEFGDSLNMDDDDDNKTEKHSMRGSLKGSMKGSLKKGSLKRGKVDDSSVLLKSSAKEGPDFKPIDEKRPLGKVLLPPRLFKPKTDF